MRSLFRTAIVAGSCLALWAGCSAKQQTEYVTGISTQVTVPRDLKSVLVEVSISGVQQFCRAYRVYDGKVQLPRSLGTFAQNDPTASGPITYTIIGISEAYTDSSTNPLFDGTCSNLAIGQNSARILRRSRQPYVPEQILFLPMPLKYACVDKNCNDDQTCKGGACVDATVADPAKTFPRYTPDLSDGTGGTCFHVSTFKAPDGTTDIPGCMTAALPAIPVDAGKCLYAVPNTPSAPAVQSGQTSPFTGPSSGDGVNVEVTFDGGLVKEVLDKDPDEGFFIPDATKPQQFQLARGLCDMVTGANSPLHAITRVRTSGTCQAKQLTQPICAADQFAAMGVDTSGKAPDENPPTLKVAKLNASKAALMLVVDDTAMHHVFFDKLAPSFVLNADSQDPQDLIGKAVRGIVQHPAFASVDLGLVYAPGSSQLCTGSALQATDVALGTKTGSEIVDLLANHSTPSPGKVRLAAGLERAYADLMSQDPNKYAHRASVVISNEFDNDMANCASEKTAAGAAAMANTAGFPTYVMQLVKIPDPSLTGDASALAVAGAPPGEANDVAYQVSAAVVKFGQILSDLATCTYDPPTTGAPTGADDVLTYDDFATSATVTIPKSGFTIDTNNRIVLNADSCAAYRKVFAASTLFNYQLYGQPSAAGVAIFARTVTTN